MSTIQGTQLLSRSCLLSLEFQDVGCMLGLRTIHGVESTGVSWQALGRLPQCSAQLGRDDHRCMEGSGSVSSQPSFEKVQLWPCVLCGLAARNNLAGARRSDSLGVDGVDDPCFRVGLVQNYYRIRDQSLVPYGWLCMVFGMLQ